MNYLLHIIVMAGSTLPAILGFNLIFGRGKILYFGSVGVSLFVAYAVFLTLRATGSYSLGIAAGSTVAIVASLLFAWLAIRLDGDAFGILSIAAYLSMLAVVINWTSVTRGTLGLPQIARMSGIRTLPEFALVTTVVAILTVIAMRKIDNGPLGRALGALAENRFHAEALGISRVRATVLAFLIAGAGALISNTFFPQYIGLLHPNDYQFQQFIFNLMCIVAGGPGSVLGVTIATILLVLLQEGMRFLPLPLGILGPMRLLLFGLILLVAVYVRRETLFPKPRTV